MTIGTQIADIFRYPVKGLSAEPLDRVTLGTGEGLPGDRRFALAHGASRFDVENPGWQQRREFLVLAHEPRLAALQTGYDEATGVLTIRRDGQELFRESIEAPAGRAAADRFIAAQLGPDDRGPLRLVEAPGVMFTDMETKYVSILSLASAEELGTRLGAGIDIRRFRGNLVVEGLEPWQELDWPGRELRIGQARLRVVERIQRCAATNVNPDTAERDLNIPGFLVRRYRHADFGVYAKVVEGGAIATGDGLALA
ncbi:MOSC domain-containing protein [Rhodospirillaceae bacterium SYSU D60014]|uniref:MOSC domain-containing protein n=1 Tax=Virgifigura deserti TaxID=2268457 RepID=UPI000E664A4C